MSKLAVQPMKTRITQFLGSRRGIALTGIAIGLLGAILSELGNPPNSGFCVIGSLAGLIMAIFPSQSTGGACLCSFQPEAGVQDLREAGAQGIQPADYIRPEFVGLALGAFVAALLFREFRARAGSAPVLRFILGLCGMMGILVFGGCPVRALLRLGGGDLNAGVGLGGLVVGIAIGVQFIRSGFELRGARSVHPVIGLLMPVAMAALLVWMLVGRSESPFRRPPLLAALSAGLLVGFLAQRSRFCIMSSFRNVALMRSVAPLIAVGSVVAAALLTNVLLGQVRWGFSGQPFAHSNQLWNSLGMVVGGLAFTLAGACPTRQLFLSGEGDVDALFFVMGMFVAIVLAQGLEFVIRPDIVVGDTMIVGGPNPQAIIAAMVGLAVCLAIGASKRGKWKAAHDLPG